MIAAKHTSQSREVNRALLILEMTKSNPTQAAKRLKCNREKAYRWYHRIKNLETREDFLTDKSHRIRFVYTPKHCSWLNQIERGFGILTRKILRHGSFKSTDELRNQIENFIEYYNRTMAKVFK